MTKLFLKSSSSATGPDAPLPAADGGSGGTVVPSQILHGVPRNPLTDALLLTVSYNAIAKQFTLTPTESTFDIWVLGTKYTFTDAQTTTAHAATTGPYFCYVDSTGAIQVSGTAWDIGIHVPIAFAYYNASLGAAIVINECHHADGRDRFMHAYLHHTYGAQLSSGCTLGDYLLDTNTDASMRFSVSPGVIRDEDLPCSTAAVVAAGPYLLLERSDTDASNTWTWSILSSATDPFVKGTTYPYYNQNNVGTWQRTEMASSNFFNMWVVGIPIDGSVQIALVMGQGTHASQSAAESATPPDMSLISERVYLYRLTFRCHASYGTTAKTRLMSVAALSALTRQTAPTLQTIPATQVTTGWQDMVLVTTTLNNDASTAVNFAYAMSDGVTYTLANPTNLSDGKTYRFLFYQGGASGTGALSSSYGSVFAFPNGARPTPAVGAGKISIIEGVYRAVTGKINCTMAVDFS